MQRASLDRNRPRLRRALDRVHRGLGALCVGVVGLVAGTGAAAVFRHEIEWLVNPALRVPAESAPIDVSAVLGGVQAELPDHLVRAIGLPIGPRFAAEVELEAPDGAMVDVLVHPRTGTVRAVRPMDGMCFAVSDCLRQAHVRLLLGAPGRLLVGVTGLLLLALLVTGTLLHVKTRSARRARRHVQRRKSAMQHRRLGLVLLPFALLLTITGVVLAFEGYLPTGAVIAERGPHDDDAVTNDPARLIAAALREVSSQATLERIRPPLPGDGVWSFDFREHDGLGRARRLLVEIEAKPDGRAFVHAPDSALDTLEALHVGSFARESGRAADTAIRIAWTFAAIALVLLALTGLAARRARSHRAERPGTEATSPGPLVTWKART